MLIQAKRYSSDNKVGVNEVRKYATLWQQEPDADRVLLVTTSTFTSEVKKIAAEQRVSIINGSEFVDIMEEEEVASDVSSTSQQDDSMPDSSLDTFIFLLFLSPLWEEADSVIIGIIAWFILSPLLITVAGLYAGVVILHAVLTMGTGGENEPTESEPSKQPDN